MLVIGPMTLIITTFSIIILSQTDLFATLSIYDTKHNSIKYHYGEFFIVTLSVIILIVIILSVLTPEN